MTLLQKLKSLEVNGESAGDEAVDAIRSVMETENGKKLVNALISIANPLDNVFNSTHDPVEAAKLAGRAEVVSLLFALSPESGIKFTLK